MKAYLEDGNIIDLGSDYIRLVGESGDGEHILIHQVKCELSGCLVVMAAYTMVIQSESSTFDLSKARGTNVFLPGDKRVLIDGNRNE